MIRQMVNLIPATKYVEVPQVHAYGMHADESIVLQFAQNLEVEVDQDNPPQLIDSNTLSIKFPISMSGDIIRAIEAAVKQVAETELMKTMEETNQPLDTTFAQNAKGLMK